MKLKIKKIDDYAEIPERAYAGDAGFDLTAVEVLTATKQLVDTPQQPDRSRLCARFGIAVEIPPGHVGKIYPRSSIYKTCCRLSNGVGVIDSGYRGELQAVFDVLPHLSHLPMPDWSKPCVQLVVEPLPEMELEVVDELCESERGEKGYGSSDERREA